MLWSFNDQPDERLVYIKSNCISISIPDLTNTKFIEMLHWCHTNIGHARDIHPLNEIISNKPAKFEGDWSGAWIQTEDIISFWFKNQEYLIAFKLAFING